MDFKDPMEHSEAWAFVGKSFGTGWWARLGFKFAGYQVSGCVVVGFELQGLVLRWAYRTLWDA